MELIPASYIIGFHINRREREREREREAITLTKLTVSDSAIHEEIHN